MFWKFIIAIVGVSALLVSGCQKDNSTAPEPVAKTMFTVTLENIAMAKQFSASGVFNTPVGGSAPAPIGPGQAYEFSFQAAPGSKLSLATMFVHSNDFFYAPDEAGIALFDANGQQLTGDVTSQIKLWDAGTEINQEPGLGADQAPRQAAANSGAADPINTVRPAPDDFSNLPAVNAVIRVTLSATAPTGFTVRIENVSTNSTLVTSDGNSQAVPLAPGVWVVHTSDAPLFSVNTPDRGEGLQALAEDGDPTLLAASLAAQTGVTQLLAPGVYAIHTSANPLFTPGDADRGMGLESLAEDGDPGVLAGNLTGAAGVSGSGVFSVPAGAAAPGPLTPGNRYEFEFEASAGENLSFATMLVQSNDLFLAPSGDGISLFNQDGSPRTGDVTGQIMLWDAGTEVNELPGVGLNQAPRQSGPNSGPAENGTVHLVNDGFSYPPVSDIIRVTLGTK